jgi:hypothetical protein
MGVLYAGDLNADAIDDSKKVAVWRMRYRDPKSFMELHPTTTTSGTIPVTCAMACADVLRPLQASLLPSAEFSDSETEEDIQPQQAASCSSQYSSSESDSESAAREYYAARHETGAGHTDDSGDEEGLHRENTHTQSAYAEDVHSESEDQLQDGTSDANTQSAFAIWGEDTDSDSSYQRAETSAHAEKNSTCETYYESTDSEAEEEGAHAVTAEEYAQSDSSSCANEAHDIDHKQYERAATDTDFNSDSESDTCAKTALSPRVENTTSSYVEREGDCESDSQRSVSPTNENAESLGKGAATDSSYDSEASSLDMQATDLDSDSGGDDYMRDHENLLRSNFTAKTAAYKQYDM